MNLGFIRSKFRQDASETQRILAERRAQPVVTIGGRITLVEHNVDDRENRRQTARELSAARDFEGDALFGEGPFGAYDALGDGRLGYKECTCDLFGRQASEQAEGKRNPSFH